jgi:translation initiation factor 2 subunit 1
VHGIAKRLAETQHLDRDEVLTKWVWPLYDKYTHPYDAFKLFASNEEDIYADIEIATDVKEALRKIVSHQLAVQPVKV